MSDKESFVFEFEQDWNEGVFDTEDGGMAIIYEIDNPDFSNLFVRIQSWDETKRHKYFNECLRGRRLKVTIETMD
jgi:hypothetical protein